MESLKPDFALPEPMERAVQYHQPGKPFRSVGSGSGAIEIQSTTVTAL
jgi:hypothetical protein